MVTRVGVVYDVQNVPKRRNLPPPIMSKESPSLVTEHAWLAKGLQDGHIRHDTAKAIMHLLENLATGTADKFNDLPVYRPLGYVQAAEAACEVPPEDDE